MQFSKNFYLTLILFSSSLILTIQQNNQICNIKNCENCSDSNSCLTCKKGFELHNKSCYSTECSVFGFCNLCNNYDCIRCEKGYKLLYGTCDIKQNSKLFIQVLSYIIPSFVIIIILIIFFICRYLDKKKIVFVKDNIIKEKHPKCGNYIIVNTEKSNLSNNETNISHISYLQTSSSSSFEKNKRNEKLNKKKENKGCILCNKESIFICNCGCGLCKEHYNKIKNENLICPIHNINLEKKFYFSLDKKSNIKGCAIENLGQQLCPICKINTAVQGFNCNCNMKLCLKCFNENVYVFKYNTCPGCGKKN